MLPSGSVRSPAAVARQTLSTGDITTLSIGFKAMASLWPGLLKIAGLLVIGTVSWALSLYLRERRASTLLGNLLLFLFVLSFVAAIMLIVSTWYAGEDCLSGMLKCLRPGP